MACSPQHPTADTEDTAQQQRHRHRLAPTASPRAVQTAFTPLSFSASNAFRTICSTTSTEAVSMAAHSNASPRENARYGGAAARPVRKSGSHVRNEGERRILMLPKTAAAKQTIPPYSAARRPADLCGRLAMISSQNAW